MTDGSVYLPLPPKSHIIRLLELQPGPWSDDVRARLHEVKIADAQDRYITISYTWGSIGTVKEVMITCNRRRVPISENLFTILRRLRQPDRAILVWADALCINQTDASERTHQVGLMGEIYRNSRETVIWLGEESSSDDTGVVEWMSDKDRISWERGGPPRIAWHGDARDQKFLNTYPFSDMRQFKDGGEYLHKAVDANLSNDIFGAFCLIQSFAQGVSTVALPFLEENEMKSRMKLRYSERSFLWPQNVVQTRASRIWNGFERLMSRPWWSRIWVIQETVLSRKATVQFGTLSAPWSMFADAATHYARESHSLCLDLAGISRGHELLTRFSHSVLQIDDTRRHHQASMNGATLLSLLWKFRPHEASDKRDKVFALLGLTTNWQGLAPMSPNYNVGAGVVFVQTAIHNIQRSGSLSALTGDLDAALGRKRLNDIPSWVMDWALPCLPIEISRVESQKMYNASGGRTGEVYFHQRHSILHAQGVYVDDVIAVGNVSRHTQITDTCAVIRQWNLAAMVFEKRYGDYPSGGTYSDAFWRTLVGDLVQTASVANSSDGKQATYRRATADDADAFRAWRMWSRCISRDTLNRTASFTQRDLDEGISSIHYALKTATVSRRFFITRSGYMGIGPKSTQPRDKMYVLENSRVPFLVRPHSLRKCRGGPAMKLIDAVGGDSQRLLDRCFNSHSCHRLVGDCFSYGLMDGEAFERPGAAVTDLYLV